MRCAPLGPTPGSRPSSSMRLWTTPSYTSGNHRPGPAGPGRLPWSWTGPTRLVIVFGGAAAEEVGKAGYLAGAAAAERRERAHLLLLELPGGPVGVADRREHEIGNGLRRLGRIRRVNGRGADRQIHKLALAVDRGGDEATACCAFHLGVRQFLLGIHELALHLLRGGEQLLHVHLAALIQCGPPRLGQPLSCRTGGGRPTCPACLPARLLVVSSLRPRGARSASTPAPVGWARPRCLRSPG